MPRRLSQLAPQISKSLEIWGNIKRVIAEEMAKSGYESDFKDSNNILISDCI